MADHPVSPPACGAFPVLMPLPPLAADQPIGVAHVEGKGRGVVALRAIAMGEVLEQAHVIVVPQGEAASLDGTVLEHYVYDWPGDRLAVVLGYGSLFNHSYRPNARYRRDPEARLLVFEALADVRPGEELTINYNGDPTDRSPLWFEVVDQD